MADLAIGISKVAVEALVDKVKNAIKKEAEMWQTVHRDTVFMKDEFEMMQSFLKTADWEQVKNTVGRTWVRQVRELSFDAEDSIESILLLDTKKRSFWTIWRLLVASCSCDCNSGVPSPLEQAVAEIQLLKARVEEVSSRNMRYNLLNDSGSKPQQLASVPAGIGTAAAALDILTEAWWTEQKLGGLVNLTMLVNESTDALRVISLWGTRGDLGTTSIIKEAYEKPVICQKFRSRAWLKLAHPFNPHEFIQSLAEQFYGNSVKDGREVIAIDVLTRKNEVAKRTNLVKQFVQQLSKHRYLVVLEGLSNMSEWQAVRTYLPDSKNGSRIVVLTQQLEIARLCAGQSYQVSELRKLPDNHSICALFNEGFKRVEEGIVYSGSSSLQQSAENIDLVGRSSDMNELSELISSASRGDRPHVISVWGFPGVGKSSLVKAVWSLEEFSNHRFMFKWYVDVSYPFNFSVFCRRVLSYTNDKTQKDGAPRPVLEDGKTDAEIIQECTELLKNCQCLLVIDGLRSKEDWDSIKQLIPAHSQTSIIVVVTAEESVAKYCAVQDDSVYRMKALEPEAAIQLFEKDLEKVFEKKLREVGTFRDDAHIQKEAKNILAKSFKDDPHVQKEVKYILAMCGGIPKVIIALAKYLGAQQGDIRQWKLSHLKTNFINELETNPGFVSSRDLFSWMRLKFDALPWCLKRCILYQSVFSEVKRIRMRPSHFVRRWIAEGYSKCTNSKTMEEYATELFNRLSKETVSMGEWRVNSFFHEYINSRLMEERAVFFPLIVSILDKSRSLIATEGLGQHLIIRRSWNRDEEFVFEDLSFSHLQSLTVYGSWKPFFIPYKMKSLRVLDLEGTSNIADDELQRILELLPRLRFLSLRGQAKITHLPDSFSELRHLQTLDIRRTSIMYVELQKLQKLQYFRAGTCILSWISGRGMGPMEETATPSSGTLVSCLFKFLGHGPSDPCNGIKKVPGGIRHLKALHTLGAVNVNTEDGKGLLDEIHHLKQLKKLELSGINRKNSKYLSKAILNQKNLESLSLQLEKENHVLRWDHISPPSSVRSLKLYGHVEKLSALRFNNLRNLRKLSLEMTRLLTREDMELLGSVQSLLTLRLRVHNHQDGELQFPVQHLPVKKDQDGKNKDSARPPIRKDQTDGEHKAPVLLPVNKDQDGKQQVLGRLFSKLQVLEIACKSKLHVRFYEGGMEKLEVLKAHYSSESPLHLHGLKHAKSLRQVWLLGSYDDTPKKALQKKLASHPKKPALKLHPKPEPPSSQVSRQ